MSWVAGAWWGGVFWLHLSYMTAATHTNNWFDKNGLEYWLSETDSEKLDGLFAEALRLKQAHLGAAVHLRGLIEFSNCCQKNCLYCGIRADNTEVARYELSDEQILAAADFAWKVRYGSLVIQSGERSDKAFTERITRLVAAIKAQSQGQLGLTLSCGEQTKEVYERWFAAGAHRYLLRIESSDPELYAGIHPQDGRHAYERRLRALYHLKEAGYQTGTGVMIGLPGQTPAHLAADLLFFRDFDVDMVGMGPYLEHADTPMYVQRDRLWPAEQRLQMTLKMIALLRLLLPDINIAATTALQVIDPYGRERAVLAGANIIMPNMTDTDVRANYQIYNHKPGIHDDAALSKSRLEANLQAKGIPIGWGQWGDSRHFAERKA